MKTKIECLSLPEFKDLALRLSQCISFPSLVFLSGPLGAGKTTFVSELLRAWGYDQPVTSPTFALVHEYKTKHGLVVHFDLYRIKNAQEIYALGFYDYLDEAAIILIEWPQKAEACLPEPNIHIDINYHEEGREVNLQGVDLGWESA